MSLEILRNTIYIPDFRNAYSPYLLLPLENEYGETCLDSGSQQKLQLKLQK